MPWARPEALISPHDTKPRRGRLQMRLAVMLQIYLIQQWCGLSGPGAEEALYDMHSMRDFAGLELASDPTPSRGLQANPCRAVDETTILNFRHLPERCLARSKPTLKSAPCCCAAAP